MATAATATRVRKSPVHARHIVLAFFVAFTLFVAITRDLTLLNSHSFLRQRYAPFAWLLLLHGVPGAIALLLGILQFSHRLRSRHLSLHRVMGRVYVGCVAISAPMGVVVAYLLPLPTLLMAASIQAVGWLATAGTGLYCARAGRIQQHREWMIRSYPFAMVFVMVRVINVIPAVARTGPLGLATVVWSVIATACFLPSFLIAWQHLKAERRVQKVRAAA